MDNSNIGWTTDTLNIFTAVRNDQADAQRPAKKGWMCVPVSPGCLNCYAWGLNTNRRFGNGLDYRRENLAKIDFVFERDRLAKQLRKTKARMVFVNSMTDTFLEEIDAEWIMEALDEFAAAGLHVFQILTKREERMHQVVTQWLERTGRDQVPTNIWLGVTAEDQARANQRIPWLLKTPAAVRWVSVEPMLEYVDLSNIRHESGIHDALYGAGTSNELDGLKLDWVVAGAESGTNARLFDCEWILRYVQVCRCAEVALFVKQFGARPLIALGSDREWPDYLKFSAWSDKRRLVVLPGKGDDPDQWPVWAQVQEWPEPPLLTEMTYQP